MLAAEIKSFRRLLGVLDLRDRNLREWRRRRSCFVSDKNGSNAAPEVLWLSATGFPFTSAYSTLRFIGGCIWWKAKAHSGTSGLPDKAISLGGTVPDRIIGTCKWERYLIAPVWVWAVRLSEWTLQNS